MPARVRKKSSMVESKKKVELEPLPPIAITGTSGFKGSRLLKQLEDDPRVTHIISIDQKKQSFETKKTKFYHLNLTDTLADVKLVEIFKKENVQTLVHCAIPITPPKNLSYAHELISIGTMYLLNACAAANVHKVILASTTDVYGALPTNPNFLLEDIHEPKGARLGRFLADKIEAEKQMMRFAKKHPDRCVTILRPCTILGPTILSYKTRLLRRPFVATILGFDPLLQFVHEEDLLSAFSLAIEKDFPGIFNIVGKGVLPFSRIIELAGKFNLRLPQLGFKSLIQMLWYVNISPAPASHVNFLRYLCLADGNKAEKIMGFKPKFTTKEALLSFIGAERLRDVNLFAA